MQQLQSRQQDAGSIEHFRHAAACATGQCILFEGDQRAALQRMTADSVFVQRLYKAHIQNCGIELFGGG